jgi:hypothetical protein
VFVTTTWSSVDKLSFFFPSLSILSIYQFRFGQFEDSQVLQKNLSPQNLGPMLWFFKYFRRKIQQKNWRFSLKTKLNYAKFWS